MSIAPGLNCANCGAALPPDSSLCAYCHSQADIDLANLQPRLAKAPDKPRPCPVCREPMRTIDLDVGRMFLIERCERCYGLFFDSWELGALTNLTVHEPLAPNYRRLNQLLREMPLKTPARRAYVPCPICAQPMNRRNFGLRSGVAIDECREDGVWLEAGELRRILRWVKNGGPEHMIRRRREEVRQMERRERARRVERAASVPIGGATLADRHDYVWYGIGAAVVLLLRLLLRA